MESIASNILRQIRVSSNDSMSNYSENRASIPQTETVVVKLGLSLLSHVMLSALVVGFYAMIHY